MKIKMKLTQLLAIMLTGIMVSIPSVFAANESVYSTLYFKSKSN